jgi:hypothetical protein
MSKILTRIIDPSSVGIQALPFNKADFAIAASNAHLLAFDNTRGVPAWISDLLCIASSGGSASSRQLYTDSEQVALLLHVALIVNGIHAFASEPDLAQRCLVFQLPLLPENKRRPEEQLLRDFEGDLPAILRGLYELIAKILRHLPDVQVEYPERMIDFVRWLAAMEVADGAPPGAYQFEYSDALQNGQRDSLLDNVLASALLEFSESAGEWSGTSTELLAELNRRTPPTTQRSKDWPNNPIALSKRIVAFQASLRTQGIQIELGRGKARNITISRVGGRP